MGEDYEKAVDRELRKIESVKRVKDQDLYEIVEEVFDSSTIMTIMDLQRRGCIRSLKGVISAGKESRVYWGIGKESNELAVKIYLTLTSEFRRSMWKYLAGDPRFERYKGLSPKKLIYMWAKKEFSNLKKLYRAKVNVPKPICVSNNVLVMEFIGEKGVRAPLLKEYYESANPSDEELQELFNAIVEEIKKMYVNAELVHGDLSEYNIMIYRNKPYIIDVSQAVLKTHPNAHGFLKNDIYNIARFFSRAGLEVPPPDEIYRSIAS